MRRATCEGIVRNKAIFDVAVVAADQTSQFKGERRRKRNRIRDEAKLVGGGDALVGLEHMVNHVVGVKPAHIVDDAAGVSRLLIEDSVGELA